MATGKKLHNLITRGLFSWSDGEGTGDRLDHEGPAIHAALEKDADCREVALTLYPLPRKGVDTYAFIETERGDIDADRLNAAVHAENKNAQPVAALPRRADGAVRDDILRLVAMNQITELDAVLQREPELAAVMRPIVDSRLNWTDRRISRLEK